MFGVVCSQCKNSSNGTINRLVRDTCGHEKCRMCLLLDEEKCQQCTNGLPICKIEIVPNAVTKQSVDSETAVKLETPTGVITTNGVDKVVQNIVDKKGEEKMKPPTEIFNLKGKGGRSKKIKDLTKKRTYQNIVIPNHITTLKNPLQYKCNICQKQFYTKSHIKYHIYCTGKAKPFSCDICGNEFVIKTHLDIHMLKHTNLKPHTCEICKKSFREKSKLKRHGLLHSEKTCVCAECGKSYHTKESLKLHTLIHKGDKPYVCRICSLKFNNTSNLNKHLISHSNEKTQMCDQCGKTFKLKWALNVHRKSHLRIRPFQCTDCTKSFVNNKDLQRHLLIHLDSKAYECTICSTTFRRKDNLYRHIKNTHPGKKIEAVAKTVTKLLVKPSIIKPVDNPNAINVITASPACKVKNNTLENHSNYRTGTVINGPLKLAFKTNAFKNNYNIHRDCNFDFLPPASKPFNLAESVDICQKILSSSEPPARPIHQPTSTEICHNILSTFSPKPLHYETSFEHKKHAIIKNIKFKLPDKYTNINRNNDRLKDFLSMKPVQMNNNFESPENDGKKYTELKSVQKAATSVIVNNNNTSNIHWRRRTLQNHIPQTLEN